MARRKEEEEDRISKFPDALLHYILSFMDTDEAVKTCVLSKRWRYLWASLPSLCFNSDSYIPRRRRNKNDFVNVVNQVIMRGDPIPITKFCFSSEFDLEATVVEAWLCYAVKHQVKHIQLLVCIINFRHFGVEIKFPGCFYGCESLTTLDLNECGGDLVLRASFGLPSLKSLRLECVNNFDGAIFSTCPNLETLQLQNIDLYFTPNFSISAPNLKSLNILHERGMATDFYDCKVMIVAPKLSKFSYFGPAPIICSSESLFSLDQVEISVDHPHSFNREDDEVQELAIRLFKMINQFHSAKSITLSVSAIMYLTLIPSSLNEHPSPFSNLKYLKVQSDWWSKSENVSIPNYIFNYFLKKDGVFQYLKYVPL